MNHFLRKPKIREEILSVVTVVFMCSMIVLISNFRKVSRVAVYPFHKFGHFLT